MVLYLIAKVKRKEQTQKKIFQVKMTSKDAKKPIVPSFMFLFIHLKFVILYVKKIKI